MRRTRIPTRPYVPGESNTPRPDFVRRLVRTFAEYEADFSVTVNGIRRVLLQECENKTYIAPSAGYFINR